MNWQPIETAPVEQFVLIAWADGVTHYHVEVARLMDGVWSGTRGTWTTSLGWTPTHWTPLPEPPSEGRE